MRKNNRFNDYNPDSCTCRHRAARDRLQKEGEHHPARGKDAVVRIRVQDEKGNSLGGIPILIYDETGYEKFEKNRNTPPTDRTVTQADGEIVYRLPYDKWLKKGSRFPFVRDLRATR